MVVQDGGPEQLVNETIRVDPGHLHAPSGLCTAIVGDIATRRGRLLVAPLQGSFATIQRTRLDTAEHGRCLGRGYGRAARRQAERDTRKQIDQKYRQ